ncbi:MAG: fructosamine kinase family protein [Anaerolineales bacterium]|nr:fructosamine kinase family protein [Anaerolineales bacterium]
MNKVPEKVTTWLEENGYGPVLTTTPIGGGCINNGAQLVTKSGKSFFLKTNSNAPVDMFAMEMEGLQALTTEDGPRVPRPILYDNDFLLVEYLAPADRVKDFSIILGQQLAKLHKHSSTRFGFDYNNYIGSTPQQNTWTEDGYVFFARHRLTFQAELAAKNGYLGFDVITQISRICSRLKDLLPDQPPSLLHGDLWDGNVIADSVGMPAIIDPAVYYGWAEAELAFTTMFGGFSEAFYQAYQEVNPLEKGWQSRFPLYNLYHYLNHLNLFGGGYLNSVMSVIRQFN